jgi:hypothetical protein
MIRERLLTGWNIRRIFYLVAGAGLVAMSVTDGQWFGVAFGIYFASMGLFSFGCASGQCGGGACMPDDVPQSNRQSQ